MDKLIIKSKLDDKYYKIYKYLFNNTSSKFNLINTTILFNFTYNDDNSVCKNSFEKYNYHKYYNNIFMLNIKLIDNKYNKFNTFYDNYIIDKFQNNSKRTLFIINSNILSRNYIFLKKKNIGDVILINNMDYSLNLINKIYKPYINNMKINSLFNNYYSSYYIEEYKQFLVNLKNNNEDNNISIPKQKYNVINFHTGYITGLGLSPSYKMNLQIPHLISTLAMSLKIIEKDGILLLFWSIVNVNIPVIKKILSILAYGFKNVEIIDNDINQNLLIGVPEYYIKCSGYKDNISIYLINKLLDIAIETIDYTYDKCNILDYYEDYTEKNPNHSLFYNKTDETTVKNRNRKYTKTKKSSRKSSSSKSSSSKSSSRKSSSSKKHHITPIYYIEDMNIPELDEIMKDSNLQFKVSLIMNKLEGIFVGYFEMVNNLIVNAIATDKKGQMYVKPEAILQKDITNLTRLINMFEYNKLPYNKHALKVLLGKQDEIVKYFYALDSPINKKLIKYNDRTSKLRNKNSLFYFKLSRSYNTLQTSQSNKHYYENDLINDYYNRIKLAYQVKEKLLEDLDFKTTPPQIQKVLYNFSAGLIKYINKNTINNDFLKLWEILNTFNLIPPTSNTFKVLHLSEITGQTILSAKYWVNHNCPKLKSNGSNGSNDTNDNYEWLANTINPYNKTTKKLFGIEHSDNYNLIKDNYDKWVFGNDTTGNLTTIQNIKNIMNEIKNTKNHNQKVDLIISDNYNSNIYSSTDSYTSQKIDLSHVISVIACSTIGGSCCVKHFIPYVKIDKGTLIENTMDLNNFFIGYLYLYYTLFDSISLYKPNTSNADNGEFYVVGKGFKGVNDEQIENLFKLLYNFTLNTKNYTTIIEPEYIPETFINQIMVFLEDMSNLNILNLEKQNLLLTCYKNFDEEDNDKLKFKKTNKILKCNYLFNNNKYRIDTMLLPKYKEWMKIYNFPTSS